MILKTIIARSFFFILLFCVTSISCKKTQDPPAPVLSQHKIFTALKVFNVPNNSTNVKVIAVDSVTQDVLLIVSPPGKLATNIIVSNNKNSALTAVDVDPTNFWPITHYKITPDLDVSTQLRNFNAQTGTIDIEVKDNISGKTDAKTGIKLSTATVTKLINLESTYRSTMKSARQASIFCLAINTALRTLQDIACVLSVEAIPLIIASGYGITVLPAYIVDLEGDCSDVLDPIPTECVSNDVPLEDIPQNCISALLSRFKIGRSDCVQALATALLKKLDDSMKKRQGQSTGDPHIITTDGYYYDFQGYGEFIAIKSTVDNFEVQIRQEDLNNTKSATMNTALGIQTGTDIVSITAKPFNIYINDQTQNLSSLPIILKNGASVSKVVENSRDTYIVTTTNGDAVKFYVGGSNSLDYSLYLNGNRKGKVIGLFGNFDGDRTNDLQTRDGKVIEYSFNNLYPTFTDSWRIDAQPNYAKLLYYESGKDTRSYTVRGFPASPTALAAQKLKDAETTCRNAGVTSEPYLSNCIFDVAVTNDQSFAKSALWNQQTNPSSGIPYGSDIDEIKNIRVTISDDPITQNDSCFISYRTGKVFRVKDGAAHATEIDGFFSYYCGINMFKAARVLQGGGGLFAEMRNQKWSIYRDSPVEYEGFLREDNPSDPNKVDAALWDYIKTTADIRNSFYSLPKLITNTDQIGETNVINASQGCTPDGLMNKTLRRFRTQEGKLGVIRFTNWGKMATGWWLTMDIKIQK